MALNDGKPGGVPGNAERDPGLDRLYHAAGREEPPARLDAAILAAARREVGARPRPLSSAVRRWHVPVSIAALVVLSVSLVTLVKEEGGESLLQPAPGAVSSSPSAAVVQPAKPAQPAPASPDASLMRQGAPALAPPPAPARPAQREDVGAGAGAPSVLGKTTADSMASGPGLAASESAGSAAPKPAAKPQPQPFRDSVGMAEQRAAPAPQAAPGEDLAARAPAAVERRAAPMAAAPASEPGARSMMQARKEVAGAASGGENAPVWHGYEKEPPQKWLERITELKRERRITEAEAMLVEFKRRFPSHPLPTELQ